MKYCPTCGKELQYDAAEICPGCGCRIPEVRDKRGHGHDRIVAIMLVAIFVVLCVIAACFLLPQISTDHISVANKTVMTPVSHQDNSLSIGWNSMDDWNAWKHESSWEGTKTGPCSEYGPLLIKGYEDYGSYVVYGANVSLLAGSVESGIERTFTDPTGEGWNTLTVVGLLSASDTPSGRWMKIEVNDKVVFDADATQVPPGDGVVFAIPVHFTPATIVNIKISNGQKPAWGGRPFFMNYYSLRLSREAVSD